MDTRSKIVSPGALPGIVTDPVVLVTGYFDILRASHIRSLERLMPGRLAIAVRHDPCAVLPVEARAELVAALRMVDYVVTADDWELNTLVRALQPVQVVHLDDADRQRAAELKRNVHSRQSC